MKIMDVQGYYREPLSIAELLCQKHAENVMKFAIERAEEYYKEHGVSPFIKSDKYDLYMVDYGWIVGRMADYFGEMIANESDEETVDYLRMRINDDFRIGAPYENIRLLVNLFDFKGILYNGNNKKYIYNLCSYESKINGKDFYFSALILNGKWLEKTPQYLMDILVKIGNNKQYVLKYFGKNVFEKAKLSNPNERVIQFGQEL